MKYTFPILVIISCYFATAFTTVKSCQEFLGKESMMVRGVCMYKVDSSLWMTKEDYLNSTRYSPTEIRFKGFNSSSEISV